MSTGGLTKAVIGIVAFVVIDKVITSMITGTDAGSTLLTGTLRIIVASVILIAVVRGMGSD
jgi:hypothetical protein